jgi:hypothetical protein
MSLCRVVEGPSRVVVQMTLFGVGSAVHPSQGKASCRQDRGLRKSRGDGAKIRRPCVAHTRRWEDIGGRLTLQFCTFAGFVQ